MITLDKNSFSDGQIRSKIWLSSAVEKQLSILKSPVELWIFGSWYGLAAFILLVRGNIQISQIHLFDIDPEVHDGARKILNSWIANGVSVQFYTKDCCEYDPTLKPFSKDPVLLINTSCEHFENDSWIKNIPSGAFVALQSTNMVHSTHINGPKSLNDFSARMNNFIKIDTQDELSFSYPDKSFERFMLLGRRI